MAELHVQGDPPIPHLGTKFALQPGQQRHTRVLRCMQASHTQLCHTSATPFREPQHEHPIEQCALVPGTQCQAIPGGLRWLRYSLALVQEQATGCLAVPPTWNLRSLMPSSFCLNSSAKRLFSCREASQMLAGFNTKCTLLAALRGGS